MSEALLASVAVKCMVYLGSWLFLLQGERQTI